MARWKWVATTLIGISVAGFAAWHALSGARQTPSTAPESTAPAPAPAPDNLALRYAKAVQEGNCDIVIPHTDWMRERLKLVLSGGSASAEELVRAELCARIQRRDAEGNQLRQEGVEDQYVFAPGVTLAWVRDDAGRDDLNAPVTRRTWIRATFPLRSRAMADRTGRPIHSLVVGVNVSRDGCVLKANVVGNLDIDYGSLKYDWPSTVGKGD